MLDPPDQTRPALFGVTGSSDDARNFRISAAGPVGSTPVWSGASGRSWVHVVSYYPHTSGGRDMKAPASIHTRLDFTCTRHLQSGPICTSIARLLVNLELWAAIRAPWSVLTYIKLEFGPVRHAMSIPPCPSIWPRRGTFKLTWTDGLVDQQFVNFVALGTWRLALGLSFPVDRQGVSDVKSGAGQLRQVHTNVLDSTYGLVQCRTLVHVSTCIDPGQRRPGSTGEREAARQSWIIHGTCKIGDSMTLPSLSLLSFQSLSLFPSTPRVGLACLVWLGLVPFDGQVETHTPDQTRQKLNPPIQIQLGRQQPALIEHTPPWPKFNPSPGWHMESSTRLPFNVARSPALSLCRSVACWLARHDLMYSLSLGTLFLSGVKSPSCLVWFDSPCPAWNVSTINASALPRPI
ncbi:hypothetical protein VFPPC_15816 [Pochonia chlamydosporia 170]|uniref:Uncharacterized protein n=1 Tax=Pochonia chlamydosporia 170 TaxID=1380566 RepID=A0A179FRV7_METCM|nr:hypothetical protein VFPPC_15816 [Pochonia chlamydosporia 170]OAQ68342.1 hypothetical protein VFPPC_15816 [Pochonia chlamydosporia 170]